MTEVLARLQDALQDHYRLERELGQGGMATVYLAHDVKHDRDAALKVLRPELAATLGPERFLRERLAKEGELRPPASCATWRMPSPPPTGRAWSTGTSSRRTYS